MQGTLSVSIYQDIGHGYDATRRADPYISSRLLFHLNVHPGGRYLDVACGTGNYTGAMAAIGGDWFGVDESATMISAASRKNIAVNWVLGRAECLPFSTGSFNACVCTLAIHHFVELDAVFREIYRVTAGGRLVIFTTTPEQTLQYWLADYFPDAIRKSAEQLPGLEKLDRVFKRSGFILVDTEPYSVRADLQDFFLYSGKHHPEIYLDPAIRAGISTFALLASQSEVDSGCKRLASDIDSGAIAQVIEQYQHDAGDYMFVVCDGS